MKQKNLKLGTRRSMLAKAQSHWVARELERLNPGVKIELVGIETQGDRIVDIPLSKIEGKEFFVAELDQALASGEVDLTVHSMKDLSLERPREIRLGAVPKRENPRDILIWNPEILSKKTLRIGTSAPRRLDSLPEFLKKTMPVENPIIQFVEIRGNVNSRLERLFFEVSHEKKVDGVVLALAGLNRLVENAKPLEIQGIQKLLSKTLWMVLPLDECPTAPGQGALAVECRTNDEATYTLLRKLHHEESFQAIARERKILEAWGGGCHQRLGATEVSHPIMHKLLFIKGTQYSGKKVYELQWNKPQKQSAGVAWNGGDFKLGSTATQLSDHSLAKIKNTPVLFIASPRAYPESLPAPDPQKTQVWVSGIASWQKLVKRGIWVNGCGENLGFNHLRSTLIAPALGLPPFSQWVVLTHLDGLESWQDEKEFSKDQILATYEVNESPSDTDQLQALASATHIYWSSASQYSRLHRMAKKAVHHACGPGKTAKNPQLVPFPNVEAWKQWLTSNSED